MANSHDWVDWHRPYDEPGSNLARRLANIPEERDKLMAIIESAMAAPLKAA